jgi:hypothetical protein
MKLSRCLILLLPALLPAAGAKPLPETTVAQAAARIDRLLEDDLQRAKLAPTALIDDATFVRRAYLGIVGRIPSAEEARAFLDDKSPAKRAALVDQLVASPGFDSHFFNWTADLLRLQTRQEQFGLGWHVWLRQSLAEDKPWDSLVTEMLTSNGHCSDDPAVGYYLRDRNMQLDNFSNTMQVFLGRQIGCAQCHDHPFDDWSQFEYYQMAAFGGGIEYQSKEVQDVIRKTVKALSEDKTAKEPAATFAPKPGKKKQQDNNANKARKLENQKRSAQQRLTRNVGKQLSPLFKDFRKNAILEDPGSMLKLPEDYQYRDAKPGEVIQPETLFGEKVSNVAPEKRRDAFADWLTSRENPYFTKVIANRLWDRAFGHGLVDPLDDWNDDSTSAHPEVLAYVETVMKGANYDLRQFLRILYRTRLFQRACLEEEPAMGVPLAFRGPVLSRMSAEQLHDSFLVLFQGEVDDTRNAFVKSWEAYRSQVKSLLATEPKQLMVMGESAQEGEQLFRKAQSDLRDAQRALADAGTGEARVKAQQGFQEARRAVGEARRQYDPFKGMQMGKRAGGKDNNLRASEQPAPFNPGTLVRDFGGSDRQTPSSAHTEATVPQALALLNNNRTDPLSGKKTRLGQALERCKSPEEKLELLFITLFSQRPDADDKQRFLVHAKDPAALRDLTRAMLTSSRFLFIQ